MSDSRPLIHLIAGARPNFMKIAPLMRAIAADGRLQARLIHTGQHFDKDMNDVFFQELGIPTPDVRLNCGGGTHAEQTGKIMMAYEACLTDAKPACCLVVGDVNSTLACAIVAKKAGVPVAHVEAGLRSGDRGMPEEINRLVTDAITDWFFVTEPSGRAHLLHEGQSPEAIHDVGHVMVDNLLYQAAKLGQHFDTTALESDALKRQLGRYAVVTLHRPSNVDGEANLRRAVGVVNALAADVNIVFPMHPRTRKNLETLGLTLAPTVHVLGPQPYMSFLHLWKDAVVVLTDSGGLQEETTALGVPCVTMRESTERPVTVDEGSNVLAGTDPEHVLAACREALAGRAKAGRRPALWDGRSSERIVEALVARLSA
ncbi:UDP-N-acetylglucosamine 2-epimerase (non-hydrolyzing) [Pelomonas sp. UHG3]|uniref:UDP-N-acetylglucosamine 2-epimerase (Non-hydrolyzing) n=1 Tax=Roseateles hydrophilus TaxID=2975054 RepID=A0ACC6C884_9BURK|nr:UDP-N-acetylglucosamine 2-epimerase (non-hydrolyzing) [Pelomonas sp. UHG3]MCY4744637.1 UDP-N-acetylglucosamine 2-epimerase (non-hydrolyzing) [Pelomonas sp. UHG3]